MTTVTAAVRLLKDESPVFLVLLLLPRERERGWKISPAKIEMCVRVCISKIIIIIIINISIREMDIIMLFSPQISCYQSIHPCIMYSILIV